MQDLLNEKEFLQQRYNPWKVFYIFYGIAFIQVILFTTIGLIADEHMEKALIAAVLLPNITGLSMFFFNKKIALLSLKTIAIATVILFSIYYVPIISFAIIGEGTLIDIILVVAFAVVNYIICLGIMYFVMRSRKKNNPDKTSAKT